MDHKMSCSKLNVDYDRKGFFGSCYSHCIILAFQFVSLAFQISSSFQVKQTLPTRLKAPLALLFVLSSTAVNWKEMEKCILKHFWVTWRVKSPHNDSVMNQQNTLPSVFWLIWSQCPFCPAGWSRLRSKWEDCGRNCYDYRIKLPSPLPPDKMYKQYNSNRPASLKKKEIKSDI